MPPALDAILVGGAIVLAALALARRLRRPQGGACGSCPVAATRPSRPAQAPRTGDDLVRLGAPRT